MREAVELTEAVSQTSAGVLWLGTLVSEKDAVDCEEELAAVIYGYAYVYGSPGPIGVGSDWLGETTDAGFLDELSVANTGSGRAVEHVQLKDGLSPGRSAVVWQGLHLDVPSGSLRESPGGNCLLVGKERRLAQPGYYFALGNADFEPNEPVVRFYWNARGQPEAVRLVGLLTKDLNEAQIPFDLKVACSSRALTRTDGVVLYLPAGILGPAARILRRIHAEMLKANALSQQTPMWTLRVGSGLGYAEDPTNGQSFGEQRSHQAASALIGTIDELDQGRRVHAVTRRLSDLGVMSRAPHRQPSSTLDELPLTASWTG